MAKSYGGFEKELAERHLAGQSSQPTGSNVVSKSMGLSLNTLVEKPVVSALLLQEEIDALREERESWKGVNKTLHVDPTLVKHSRWANRHEDHFQTMEFEALREEIKNAGGNIQPIKVRPIKGTNPQEYEIVFGHRRHRACLDLEMPVLVMVEEMDEEALFVQMDRENRQRENLSPWEQAVMYKRALDAGLFPNQSQLSNALGVSRPNVSTILLLTELPVEILDAFQQKLDLQFRWARPLFDTWKNFPKEMEAQAEKIKLDLLAGKSKAAADVFKELTSIGKTEKENPVLDLPNGGKLLVKRARNSVSFTVENLPQSALQEIEKIILKSLSV